MFWPAVNGPPEIVGFIVIVLEATVCVAVVLTVVVIVEVAVYVCVVLAVVVIQHMIWVDVAVAVARAVLTDVVVGPGVNTVTVDAGSVVVDVTVIVGVVLVLDFVVVCGIKRCGAATNALPSIMNTKKIEMTMVLRSKA